MTRETILKANEILGKIDKLKEKIEKIDAIRERLRKITPLYATTTKIQLGEQYVYTPQCIVSLDHFLCFLHEEILALDREIKILEDELAEL